MNRTVTQSVEIAIYSVLIIPCVVVLFVGTWKRNRQPFKSRDYLPYLGLLTFIIHNLVAIVITAITFHTDDTTYKLLKCIQESYVGYPLRAAFVYLIAFQGYRYFFIMNVNIELGSMRDLKKQGEEVNEEMMKTLKLFKLFASSWVMIGGYIIVYVLWCLIITIIGFGIGGIKSTTWHCPLDLTLNDIGLAIVIPCGSLFFVCLFIAVLGVLIYDMFKNFDLIKSGKFKELFIYNDPFYLRIEYLVIIGVLIWSVITGFAFHFTPQIVRMIIITLNGFTIVLFQACFSLIIAIKWDTTKKEDKDVDEIQKVMSDSRIRKLFLDFAAREWSIENVLLYEDIWKYKNASTDAEREYLADDIVETYLKERSILSVNVSRHLCLDLKEKVKVKKITDPTLFDELLGQIKMNLIDTFHRFSKLPEFRKYKANQQMASELLKAIDSDGIIDTVKRKSLKLTEKIAFASNSEGDQFVEALKRRSQKVAESAIEQLHKAIECAKEAETEK